MNNKGTPRCDWPLCTISMNSKKNDRVIAHYVLLKFSQNRLFEANVLVTLTLIQFGDILKNTKCEA